MGVAAMSIMLYGAEIWWIAMKVEQYRMKMERSQKKILLRTARAYRTVSREALQVITQLPIEQWTEERGNIYRFHRSKKEARQTQMERWQKKLRENTGKAAWTKILIPNIKMWTKRKWGQLRAFGQYRHRIGKSRNQECYECGEAEDTGKHTVFECGKWAENRKEVEEKTGQKLDERNIIRIITQSRGNWII